MVYRLAMDKILAIKSLHASGMSRRQIGRTLGIDRKAVSRHLTAVGSKGAKAPTGEAPTGSSDSKGAKAPTGSEGCSDLDSVELEAVPPSRVQSSCEPYREEILAKLEQGLTAQRIYQDLIVEYGFGHRYSSVRRYVSALGKKRELPFRRIEVDPGHEMQVDYGTGARCLGSDGKLHKTHLFRVVLSHSRKGYTEAVLRQTTESFLGTLENAFWALGGVPKIVVIDNLKAAVTQPDWYDPELNPKILDFCEHYGCAFLPTRPATPRHKGKVERGVDYVQENGLRGKSFDSLHAQNDHLRHWEKTVADTRIHGTTKKHVGELFETVERGALQPLPASRFPYYQEGRRKVSRDGHIEVKRSYYSAPPEYLGREVWVRWNSQMVRILNHRMEQVAIHPRVEEGKFSTLGPHLASEKINGVERGAAYLLGKVRLVGDASTRWAEGALAEHGVRGVRVIQGLLSLTRKHDSQALEHACDTAWRSRAFRLRVIRRLLANNTQSQRTMEFLEAHEVIRPMSEYGEFVHNAIQGGS